MPQTGHGIPVNRLNKQKDKIAGLFARPKMITPKIKLKKRTAVFNYHFMAVNDIPSPYMRIINSLRPNIVFAHLPPHPTFPRKGGRKICIPKNYLRHGRGFTLTLELIPKF